MKTKKVGIIIQARMGSTRLPGKVLKLLDKGEKVLDVLIKRMKLCKKVDEIIIATTPDKQNSLIIDVTKTHNVSHFIGSEKNVLERYYEAAKQHNLDIVIRVTSDCPFVDPKLMDEMIIFYKNNNFDYVRNVDQSTNFVRGFEIEIFGFNVLEKIFSLAEKDLEREHVTYYIYTHPEIFTMYSYNLNNLKKFANLRLTIDEKDDLLMCREVYKKLKEKGKSIDFSVFDIYDIIEENPELMDINKNLVRKKQ